MRFCAAMVRILVVVTLTLVLPRATGAATTLAKDGIANYVIVIQPNATAPETNAAVELSQTLQQITGATFEITNSSSTFPKRAIVVGPGPIAEKLCPNIPFLKLGPDEIVMQSKGDTLVLAGGRPRGTIYSIGRFLQEQCGVRYWTAWATNIPHRATLQIPKLNVRYQPPFEYRGPFWFPAFEQKWKVHNQSNDENWTIPAELGGSIRYKGFCHTFYPLVPPEKYFADHPDWYSMVNGKRTHELAQLCLTNPKLREFMVQRVKESLRECPDCEIISVTQNDHNGWCECPDCKALDDAEGSHAGTMITFANYIAEQIEGEFPKVAVDTFAYTYTRKPPKTVQPRHNVIVRLCSIECNFRDPLDHPSNAAFAEDIKKWSQICQRLYIWDYTTEFKNYVHPHPNWFVLGPNVRFFQRYGVKGLFEQGGYAGHGPEMAEMRSWVLAQLMWNPKQDDHALIQEFLNGYYGREAGPLIYQYLQLIHKASDGLFLGCYLRKEPPTHLRFAVLSQAERLWQRAEQSAARDQELLARIRIAHLPVRYAFIKYWNWLRHDCWETNSDWPLPDSRRAVAQEFQEVCKGIEGKPWTRVHVLNERGLTVDEFLKEFGEDAKEVGPNPKPRLKNPPAPADLEASQTKSGFDLQDNVASLAGFGKWAKILDDNLASDNRAVWMPGDHSEWAFRISGKSVPENFYSKKCRVYAGVRVKKTDQSADPNSIAFTAGVYDNNEKSYPANLKTLLKDVPNGYRSYLIGEVQFNADRDVWVAPASNPGVKSIWVDRIYLVPVL